MKTLSVCPEELRLRIHRLELCLQEREALLAQLRQMAEGAGDRLQQGSCADFAVRLKSCIAQQEQSAKKAGSLCSVLSAFVSSAEEYREELRKLAVRSEECPSLRSLAFPGIEGRFCAPDGSLVFDYDSAGCFAAGIAEHSAELSGRIEEISLSLSLEEDLFLQKLNDLDSQQNT